MTDITCPECGESVPIPTDLKKSQTIVCDHCEALIGTVKDAMAAKRDAVAVATKSVKAGIERAVKGRRGLASS